jgi:hypothetical protein
MSSELLTLPESSTILPPDLVGEIAKWYVANINEYVKNKLMIENHPIFNPVARIIVWINAIPHLNKLLWCYKIMCMHANISEAQDILVVRSMSKYITHRGDYFWMMNIHIFNNKQIFKYLLKQKMISTVNSYELRENVICRIISDYRDDLFFEYLSLLPGPFTTGELKKYITFTLFRASSGKTPFKHTEYLKQKLKEIMY